MSDGRDFPPPDVEEKVVCHEAGIGHDEASQLVHLAQAIRRVEHAGLREVASTRVLIAAGLLVAAGLPLLEAARVAVAGPRGLPLPPPPGSDCT